MSEDINQIKFNLKIFWLMSEKWFRILEFSLILGTLYYFKQKTNYISITIVYWFSWIIFYLWVLELGDYIAAFIIKASRRELSANQKIFVWIPSSFVVIAIYMLITMAANAVISAK